MATNRSLQRQPDKLDYASPTQFRFGIHQLPKVEFFTVTANIPEISLGIANYATPFKDIPMMGDKVEYGQLNIGFIVDEYLENYLSLHEWMTGIGFPKDKEFLTEPYISRSKNGSGIGLAVVKKIMQDHNGNIELENNKNDKGAKISLLFPIN